MSVQKLEVVGTYSDAMAAHLCRVRLEAEGIESMLGDEYISAVYPLYTNTVGGVKLMVQEQDAPAARSIIEGFDANARDQNEFDLRVCPVCGSENIEVNARGFFTTLVLTILTIGLLLPFLYRKKKCVDCGKTW